jgi:hypothetical protein
VLGDDLCGNLNLEPSKVQVRVLEKDVFGPSQFFKNEFELAQKT